ncbi:MAG TPA: sigma 54-interacting transcriptional regulator [Acetobacteraceae bacterium]|jgi:Nif-specific regulatory protein|nr:sigma 54-interacting transcriptional regulator [Acetobacteraceae bacterium]
MLLIDQIVRLIGRGMQLDPILREMLHLMSEMLGLNRGRVVLADADAKSCRIRYWYGLTRKEAERGRYALGEGITGRALALSQLIIVQDIDKDPTFLARAVERARLPATVVSFIAMPIMVSQKAVGVLACHRIRHRNRPMSSDVAIMRILASLTGQFLELNAAMEQKTRVLEQRNDMLARALEAQTAKYGIIGTSPALLRAIEALERVSSTTATVLLLGASGTGKELFARALHLSSPRRDKPFIKVNCAAIPDTLFESELFGYERGAFTGASDARAGWFEQASSGTIFLDEIGELPLQMQTKLLRTLQEGTITRLGGKREIKVNVRLVAATNRDLQAEVTAGRFREDLFYRLNVIPIELPSLAERQEDIPTLVVHFTNRINAANQRNVNLTASAIARLQKHPWPGNIRQLSNLIERIVLLADKPVLDAEDIGPFLSLPPTAAAGIALRRVPPPLGSAFPQVVRPYLDAHSHSAADLQRALLQCRGNKSQAAQLLGLTARQFAYRWGKFGLDKSA